MHLAIKYINENELLPGTKLRMDIKDHSLVEAVIFYISIISNSSQLSINLRKQ